MSSGPEYPNSRPRFLITIDTEGDNLWAAPREITTRNAAFLQRFQQLCETYRFKPTYLTNYEMVASPVFQEFARDVLARGAAEIGMHLHAWNSPPVQPLTSDDYRYQPYLIEYPESAIRNKVEYLTKLLEDTFGVKMLSHRAGRWGMNETYAKVLVEQGYKIDCSVTPHVSWRRIKGNPDGEGGSDYSRFPEQPYWVDLRDISRPGESALLEVPMTVMQSANPRLRRMGELLPQRTIPSRVWNRLFPPRVWLQPNGRNLRSMLGILAQALRERRGYVEFTLHSSEFMPGGSPTFSTEASIEKLYRDMEHLFAQASRDYAGATLQEFEQSYRASA